MSCPLDCSVSTHRVGFDDTLGEDLGVLRPQQPATRTGSFARIPASPRFVTTELTLQAWIYPTHVTKGLQGILTHWQDGHGYGLFVGEYGVYRVGRG